MSEIIELSVLEPWNPLIEMNCPWCCVPFTADECRSVRRLEPKPVSDDSFDFRGHAGRINYLAKHGWAEPVEIHSWLPYFSPKDLESVALPWPIIDGNHRLAAAFLRGDKTILVEWIES